MSTHVIELSNKEREALIKWLHRPNGAHVTERVTFEAVEGGGVLVRTQPYSAPRPSHPHPNRTLP